MFLLFMPCKQLFKHLKGAARKGGKALEDEVTLAFHTPQEEYRPRLRHRPVTATPSGLVIADYTKRLEGAFCLKTWLAMA